MNDDLHRLDTAASEPRIRPDAQVSRRELDARTSGLSEREVHLTDYFKVLYKRRWTAITAFLLVVVGTAVYSFTATPIFEAKVRLLIESDEQNVVNFKQVVDEDRTRADYYQTQYNILQSRGLARKTLDNLELWDDPRFVAGSSAARPKKGLLAWARGLWSPRTQAAESAPADETATQSAAIDAFLDGLNVTQVRNSRLVDVSYRSPNPALATAIANSLAKAYIEQNLEYKFMATKDAGDWLSARLAEQRAEVEKAEAALQRYREQNDAISLEDRENIVVQKLADLNAALTKAKTDRIQREAVYNQLRESQQNPALLDTFPAILSNGFIQTQKAELSTLQQQLAQKSEVFADKHPEIVRIRTAIQLAQSRLSGEIAKVVQSVRSDYLAAVSQEQSLANALNEQKAAAQSMNRKAIDYGVLQRDLDSSRQIYESLLQRAKETGVAGELRSSNVRIVDEAEKPRWPVTPRRSLNMLLAIFGGLLLACSLAFFFEYMDSRIKSPDDIKALGLPHLGLLPLISSKVLGGAYPLLGHAVPANFSEAFRAIRTNVLFSTATTGCRSVVVTSTGPGEGKSMVAANMAVGLAQSGQRVLLIDGDMRKPKVHDVFDVAQEPGLSNLLVGNAKASESVRKSGVSGLWLLPAGLIPPNPAELLGSQRLRDFVHSVGEHFDWVVVDTPPVMAVTDAAVIAHSVTGVLFVVGSEMTSSHAAARALDQLENAQARFIGAVLNRVDLERNAYYYSQYYRREYSTYYEKVGTQS